MACLQGTLVLWPTPFTTFSSAPQNWVCISTFKSLKWLLWELSRMAPFLAPCPQPFVLPPMAPAGWCAILNSWARLWAPMLSWMAIPAGELNQPQLCWMPWVRWRTLRWPCGCWGAAPASAAWLTACDAALPLLNKPLLPGLILWFTGASAPLPGFTWPTSSGNKPPAACAMLGLGFAQCTPMLPLPSLLLLVVARTNVRSWTPITPLIWVLHLRLVVQWLLSMPSCPRLHMWRCPLLLANGRRTSATCWMQLAGRPN